MTKNLFINANIERQSEWIRECGFSTVEGYSYILKDGKLNLFEDIREEALSYFAVNGIKWWSKDNKDSKNLPTGDALSSQLACLNHLFPLRNDPAALRLIVKNIDARFTDVLPICCDKTGPTYVAFEVVSKVDHLNEGKPKRGEYCTSIDALVCAKDYDGKAWLIPIEWKFTEQGSEKDYSNEDRKGESAGSNGKGRERLRRYGDLLDESICLRHLGGEKPLEAVRGGKYFGSVLFKGDYYQLTRQTLWAEQMIASKEAIVKNGDEMMPVDDFFHLHVISEGNLSMLGENGEMEAGWRACLTDDGNARYKIMSPKALLSPLCANSAYSSPLAYLQIRYW